MYLEHFGLREAPFNLTPDTSFVFEHESYVDALNTLRVAVRSGEGFLKITGEIGLGKTLLCRSLLNDLQEPFHTAYIPNPATTPKGLLVMLAEELGLANGGAQTHHQLLKFITDRLLEFASKGHHVVLLVDEAQTMSDETLESVRLLTNLETEKFKLLQVILFGQPELDRRLDEPHLRQLRQRITFSYVLQPLNYTRFVSYVQHRLSVASGSGVALFSDSALRGIYNASGGTPRLINVLCHKSLMAAYGPGAGVVDIAHVREAIADTESVNNAVWYRRVARWLSRPFVVVMAASGSFGLAVAALAWGQNL